MKESFSEDFFERYAQGDCTEAEKAMLESWYLDELKHSAFRPSDTALSVAEQEIWEKIQIGRQDPKRRPRLVSLLGWASAAAILAIAMLYFYNSQFSGTSGAKEKTFAASGSALITVTKNENSFRKLSDGTVVILGQGSTLTISDTFDRGKLREVRLSGKAFFDVKHDAARPFIIHSGGVTTTVLGTSFDVLAKEKSNSVTINVIRGKVRVESNHKALAVLTPNMQMVYDKTLETAVVKSIDANKELAWNRQEDMSFDDVSLKEAKKLLEERFKVKIVVTDQELLNTKFSTSLGATDHLDSFLKSLCLFINAKYTFKNNKEVSIEPLNQN